MSLTILVAILSLGLFLALIELAMIERRLSTVVGQLDIVHGALASLIKTTDKIQESAFNIETNQPI